MSFLFKNYSIVEVAHLFIRCNKTKFFLWNTDNTDRNGVNEQNTYTKHLEKDNTGKRRGRVPTMGTSEFLFFGSAKETSNDVNFSLNLRIIKKQKPAVFWENIIFLRAQSKEGFIECTWPFAENST